MRNVSDQFQQAVLGSNAPVVGCNIWRDGEIIREAAQIAGGEVAFDMTQQVEGSLNSLSVVDDPTATEPVDAFGCQVNVFAGFDLQGTVETVSMGWFTINDVTTNDTWLWVDWAGAQKTSSVLQITGTERTSIVAESDFLTPSQPTPGADAWDTIVGLCAGIVSVLDPGFTPMTIPASGIVFTFDRLAAITSIAQLWNAYPIMNENGQLTLTTDATGDVLPPFGAQINIDWWQKQSNSTGTNNGVTYTGTATDGTAIYGYATEAGGKLRWGGPFGYRPVQMSSPLMTTQAMVDAAAQTYMQTIIARRSSTQVVSALWNPAVQLRDKAVFSTPDGDMNATVAGYTLPLLGGPMSVTLRLPWLT